MHAPSFFSDDPLLLLEAQGQALGISHEELRRIRMERELRITILFPAETRQLELIRRVTQNTTAVIPGLARETADDIALALDEACTNVIRHAYGNTHRDPLIEAEIHISSQAVTIVLTDEGEQGRAFHPSQIQPMDMAALRLHPKAGGLGFHLIRKIMDEVHYENEPGKPNRLTMRRYITRQG